MIFHEVQFPTSISFGSSGGPERRTEIVVLGSGHEERNTRWADSRRNYNAGFGIKNLDDLHSTISFFEERRGKLYGFRWKDHVDHKSCPPLQNTSAGDQHIATADGSEVNFQLQKQYGQNHSPYHRIINKPVVGSLLLSVDDVIKTETVDFEIDYTTGQITFLAGAIPNAGQEIKAGFEFDVPVRFDTDELKVNLSQFNAGDIPNIPIIEVRL